MKFRNIFLPFFFLILFFFLKIKILNLTSLIQN